MIKSNGNTINHKNIDVYERCMSHIHLHQVEALGHISPEDFLYDKSDIFIKNVPDHLEMAFATICRLFPELKNDDIRLRFQSISMTMQARPNIWTLFGGKREYFVFINTERSRNGLLLEDIPYNAQLGIIAHELCHILDYHFKTNWEIMKTGLWYLKKRNQEDYEKAIDYLVVKKGLGHQLRDWSYFVLNESNLTEKYKRTKETYYLRPEDIDHCIHNHVSSVDQTN